MIILTAPKIMINLAKHPLPYKPVITKQHFEIKGNYIAQNNYVAYLIINNPDLNYLGTLKENQDLESIKDSTLYYAYMENDSAKLIPIKEAKSSNFVMKN